MFARPTDEETQGSSIWIFIAGFTVLAFFGLGVLLLFGLPSGDSRSVRTGTGDPATPITTAVATTVAVTSAPETTTTAPATTTTAVGPPVTLPDGEAAPEGVTRVLVTGDTLSLAFRVDPRDLGSAPLAVVPPLRARQAAEGSALAISVGCAQTTREQLAQLNVTESDTAVMLSAVVLVPVDALGCNPTAEPRLVTVPLKSPLGTRRVETVPAGTQLPRLDLGQGQTD